MNRKPATAFPQELLDLYDHYAHGLIDRRAFLQRSGKFAVGGLTAAMLLDSLGPNYAWARQVGPDDERIRNESIEYPSPDGHGAMRALLVKPVTPLAPDKSAPAVRGVLVVHENRGLNPYIEDVARRVGVAGFLALAPDALTPAGGYPGNDDEGRELQQGLDRGRVAQDFVAAARFLAAHPACDGHVGVVGFCFGGGVANALAVSLPEVIKAAVPFYGKQPGAADVNRIKAALLLHYAELDERINAGWPEYEAALKQHGIDYTMHMYPGVNHGFHNDTTPRYDEAAAGLAWRRTIEFFDGRLRGKGPPAE